MIQILRFTGEGMRRQGLMWVISVPIDCNKVYLSNTWKKCKLLNYLKWFSTSRPTLTSPTTNKNFISFSIFQKKNFIIKGLFRTKMELKNLWCWFNGRKEISFLIHWVTSYPFQVLWFVALSSQHRVHYGRKAIL